ncbi:hypothetical protein Tco_1187611, partial [Tanacetum coccineum]
GFFVGEGAGLVCLTGVVVVGFLGVARCPSADTWDNTRIVEWLQLSGDRELPFQTLQLTHL